MRHGAGFDALDVKACHDNGVQTLIHYPIPPHKQKCYSDWNGWSFPVSERIHREELSLPMSPALTGNEIKTVVNLLNQWK